MRYHPHFHPCNIGIKCLDLEIRMILKAYYLTGEDMFKKVQLVCREFEENYDSHETFLGKLEDLAGADKLEICQIVDEFFADE